MNTPADRPSDDLVEPMNALADLLAVLAITYGLDPDDLVARAIERQGQIPCPAGDDSHADADQWADVEPCPGCGAQL